MTLALLFDLDQLPLNPADDGHAAVLMEWALAASAVGRTEDVVRFMALILDKNPAFQVSGNLLQRLASAAGELIGSRLRAATKLGPDQYRELVQQESANICDRLSATLQRRFGAVPNLPAAEKLLLLKLMAELYWYWAQSRPARQQDLGAKSLAYFCQAEALAQGTLASTDTSYLELILHYATCLHDIGHRRRDAISLVRRSLDAAIGRLHELSESDHRAVTSLMMELRAKRELWQDADDQ